MDSDDKKKQEAIKAAMMEELGITRMDKLPMEDRPKNGFATPGPRNVPAGTAPSQRARRRNSLAATWHDAIASGKFIDDDAATVKNLDAIGGGQLHRLGRAGVQGFHDMPAPQKRVPQTLLSRKPAHNPLASKVVPRIPLPPKPTQRTSEDGVRRTQDGKYGIITAPNGKELKFKLDANGNIPPSARAIPPKNKDRSLHQMDMSIFGNGPLPLTMDDYIRRHRELVKAAAEKKAAEMPTRAQDSKPAPAAKAQQPPSKVAPRSLPQSKAAAPQNMQQTGDLIEVAQRDKVPLTPPDRARVIAQFKIDVMPVGPRRAIPSTAYICTADPPTHGIVVVLVSCGDVDDIEYPVARLAECYHTDAELLCRWKVDEDSGTTHCFIFKNSKELARFVKTVNALKQKASSPPNQRQLVVDGQTVRHTSTAAQVPAPSQKNSTDAMEASSQGVEQAMSASGIDHFGTSADPNLATSPASTAPIAPQPAVALCPPPGLSTAQDPSGPHGFGTSQGGPSGLGLTVPPGFGFPPNLSTVSGHSNTLPAVAAPPGIGAPPGLTAPPGIGSPSSLGTPSVLSHAETGANDRDTAGPRPVERASTAAGSGTPLVPQWKTAISESQHNVIAALYKRLDSLLHDKGFQMTSSLAMQFVYELLLQSSSAFRSLDTETKKQVVGAYCTSELLKPRRTTYSLAQSLGLRERATPPPDWLSRVAFLPRRTSSARKSSCVTTDTRSSSTGASGYVPKGVAAAQGAAAYRKEPYASASADGEPSCGQQHAVSQDEGDGQELLRKQIDDIAKHIRSIHLTAPVEHWAKPFGNAPPASPKQEATSQDKTGKDQAYIVNPGAVQTTTDASDTGPLQPRPNGAASGAPASGISDLEGIIFDTKPVNEAAAAGATGVVPKTENASSQQSLAILEIGSQSSAPSSSRAPQRGLKASRFNVPDAGGFLDELFRSAMSKNSN